MFSKVRFFQYCYERKGCNCIKQHIRAMLYAEKCVLQKTHYIVFPEGDVQEIRGRLPVNCLVDLNGRPLPLPLSTNKKIVFRVRSIRALEKTGISEIFHHLELLSAEELLEYTRA